MFILTSSLGEMEECPVVIVGAGPAGLTLALSLANTQGTLDPPRKGRVHKWKIREVFVVAGDATRILYQIGIGRGHSKSYWASVSRKQQLYTIDLQSCFITYHG